MWQYIFVLNCCYYTWNQNDHPTTSTWLAFGPIKIRRSKFITVISGGKYIPYNTEILFTSLSSAVEAGFCVHTGMAIMIWILILMKNLFLYLGDNSLRICVKISKSMKISRGYKKLPIRLIIQDRSHNFGDFLLIYLKKN